MEKVQHEMSVQKVQHENGCNTKKVLYEMSATRKKTNSKKVQNEKTATQKKCNTKNVQHKKVQLEKSET